MKNAIYILLLFLFFTIGCSENKFEDTSNITDGKEFVALEMGKYRIFKYDTIAYSGNVRDTLSGYIKYEIGDSFVNNAGTTTYNLMVYHKTNASDPFILNRVETIRIEDNQLIESQNGLNFIKLLFPISKGSGWMGNKLFDNSEVIKEEIIGDNVETYKAGVDWRYKVIDVNIPVNSASFNFDNGLIVNHINDTSGVELRHVTEYFAEGIGMIKKDATILTRTSTTSNPIIQDANVGYIMNFRLEEYN